MYRLSPKSRLYEGFFNWETKTIGPYKAEPEYGYLEEYHIKKGTPPKYLLYQVMLDYPEVVAAIFINNAYICCFRNSGSMFYKEAYDQSIRLSNKSWMYTQKIDVVPIGYEKTAYKCQSVFTRPAQLMYSVSRKAVFFNENWIPIFEEPEILREDKLSLYKELVTENKGDCVYLMKGGNAVWKSFTD